MSLPKRNVKEFSKYRKTELLYPKKCQGMLFAIFANNAVKCKVCGQVSRLMSC